MTDVVVIGAGVAGLTGALRLARGGARVILLSGGIGGLQLSQGSIDILGYSPDVVSRPLDAIDDLVDRSPDHPYARLGSSQVAMSVGWFADNLPGMLTGDLTRNMRLPTAVGVARPTALAPPSLAAGALRDGMSLAIVGIGVVKDFHPGLVAQNISRVTLEDGGSVEATAAMVHITAREGEVDTSPLNVARAMDDEAFRRSFGDKVAAAVNGADAIGLPAVLGIRTPGVWEALCEQLGRPVFEIPTPPPGVPGMRLNVALTDAVRAAGVRVIMGGWVIDRGGTSDRLEWVATDSAGRDRRFAARAFLLAPGGFESGALHVDSYWNVTERALGLPVAQPPTDQPIVQEDFRQDHPLFLSGVAVDDAMRVVDPGTREPVYDNVHAAGGILAGSIRWTEKSGEGIAIASAVRAADAILKEL